MAVIDVHAHFVPPPLVAALRRRTRAPAISGAADDARFAIWRAEMPFGAAFHDAEERLAALAAAGIDRQLLSLPGQFGIDALAADEADTLTGLFNDGVRALVDSHGERFAALAALPLAAPALAVERYRRARLELGVAGMIVPADGFASRARAEAFRPLFEAAQALGGLVFVHPGPTPEAMAAGEGAGGYPDLALYRRVTLDIQNRLTEAAVTLAFSDFLDPYPEVPVLVANLGGTLPFVIERMDHVHALRRADEPPPSTRLRRFFVDCASFGPRAIALAAAVFGADRVLLGTDDPIFDAGRTVAAARAAGVGDAILGANAEALLA